jgi:hypothetical protein
MPEHWQKFNFSGTSNHLEYKSGYFCRPNVSIEKLRQLARAGKDEAQRQAIMNAGKRKVVWGVPDEGTDDADLQERESSAGAVTADEIAAANDHTLSGVAVELADSELGPGLEGTELDIHAQKIVLECNDVEPTLEEVEAAMDETHDSNPGATINSDPLKMVMKSESADTAKDILQVVSSIIVAGSSGAGDIAPAPDAPVSQPVEVQAAMNETNVSDLGTTINSNPVNSIILSDAAEDIPQVVSDEAPIILSRSSEMSDIPDSPVSQLVEVCDMATTGKSKPEVV